MTAPVVRPDAWRRPDRSAGHIVTVDDDRAVTETMRHRLQAGGYRVTDGLGRSIGAIHAAHRIDLAIVDIFMPDRDGFDILREAMKLAPMPRVLVISGGGLLPRDLSLRLAVDLGADAMLPKPFDQPTLLRRVHDLLQAGADTPGADAPAPLSAAGSRP